MRLISRSLNGRFMSIRSWWKSWTAHRGWIKFFILVDMCFAFFCGYHYIQLRAAIFSEVDAQTIIEYQRPTYEELPQTVQETIDYYAELFYQNKDAWHELVNCESGGNPERIGDVNSKYMSFSLMQFQPQTFYQYAAEYKIKNADLRNWQHQILVAALMIAHGHADAWSCVKIKHLKFY
jgi:hypothetical protein